jgi:rhomboid family GlyGly-CTERM serine protease
MRGPTAWVGVTVLFGACALAGWAVPREAIDWQPALAATQPWRGLTAVGVHYSVQHLVANLAGTALAGVFGLAALVPPRMAAAWLAAWPLTHFGLLVRPELQHYGGLSGIVHAAFAIVVAYLLVAGTRRQRIVGTLVLIGFIGKLLSEAPWSEALRHPAGWDIAVAPIAHTTGALAGALCAVVALLTGPRTGRRARDA